VTWITEASVNGAKKQFPSLAIQPENVKEFAGQSEIAILRQFFLFNHKSSMLSFSIRLPAYPNVRTEPQSDIGHNRGKKKRVLSVCKSVCKASMCKSLCM
jgi:hypothetical protein